MLSFILPNDTVDNINVTWIYFISFMHKFHREWKAPCRLHQCLEYHLGESFQCSKLKRIFLYAWPFSSKRIPYDTSDRKSKRSGRSRSQFPRMYIARNSMSPNIVRDRKIQSFLCIIKCSEILVLRGCCCRPWKFWCLIDIESWLLNWFLSVIVH